MAQRYVCHICGVDAPRPKFRIFPPVCSSCEQWMSGGLERRWRAEQYKIKEDQLIEEILSDYDRRRKGV